MVMLVLVMRQIMRMRDVRWPHGDGDVMVLFVVVVMVVAMVAMMVMVMNTGAVITILLHAFKAGCQACVQHSQ